MPRDSRGTALLNDVMPATPGAEGSAGTPASQGISPPLDVLFRSAGYLSAGEDHDAVDHRHEGRGAGIGTRPPQWHRSLVNSSCEQSAQHGGTRAVAAMKGITRSRAP